jgi:archaellum component FlaC
MSPEMESVLRLGVFFFGMAGGVYAIRRSVDTLSLTLGFTNQAVESVKSEITALKACDEELKQHSTQMKVMMQQGGEFRSNVDKVHGELFNKVNSLQERVKAVETCNDFIRKDLDNVKSKVSR